MMGSVFAFLDQHEIHLGEWVVCNQSMEMQKDNGMGAILDERTFSFFVIQDGCHTIAFWISRDCRLKITYEERDRFFVL